MSRVGERERRTQRRVIDFMQQALGYDYLGDWKDRENNRNIEESRLHAWLSRCGYSDNLISKALRQLGRAAALSGSTSLYEANRAVYTLLRYGVKVKPEVGAQSITIPLIDWEQPENNDFAVAEEVTVLGHYTKRPDVVLYVNGIALGVLELKRSSVAVSEGIRQNLDNQKKAFIRPFFSTVQLIMAGNESEGLRYGVIKTQEKYWLQWKEADAHPTMGENPLLKALGQLCSKERLLELIHDFIVFDGGTKKICRHNQYTGVRKAQPFVRDHRGGIIWHTQGSGKSLTMVWLAKWIRKNMTNARVLIITDRKELDEQIEKVFQGVDEQIYRTRSGADLVRVLNQNIEWLICSLIHKFGTGDDLSAREIDSYVDEIRSQLPTNFVAKGDIFVFVDECHRTQSGKLHEAMKVLLPDATFIGFTGTPLLKKDRQTSLETFGPYIDSYKYDEAVSDGVVLDLRYEARDIDQSLSSPAKVDQWFEAKTRGLTDVAKAQLKQRWGTMQKVLSSRERLTRIVSDIQMDMMVRPRLADGHGNALLVTASINSACRVYDLLNQTDLRGKCAIVTSYQPTPSDIKGEESGEGLTERLERYDIYRRMLADHFNESEDTAMSKAAQFEQEVKKRFIEQPGRMKLLIVVDKLLTGFDAPSATYLYIDKAMQDHGLFQAICRVNRLDGEDKEYGYIIDYKDLFNSLESSIRTYTGDALDGYDEADVAGLLKDRLVMGRERLETMREAVKALCEPVAPPYHMTDYFHYFVAAESGNASQMKANEPKRVQLYKLVASLLRAYANLASELAEAGYDETEIATIKAEVAHYEKMRDEVKLASGDYVDMKMYEPAMRQLIDQYIRAEESERLSAFDDMSLVELIVEEGEAALEALPADIRRDPVAMAETIENNVRRLIIDEMAVNPHYYEQMSTLLDALIEERRRNAVDYKAYLARIVALSRQVSQPEQSASYPPAINSATLRALYDNLPQLTGSQMHEAAESYTAGRADPRATLALAVDREIRAVKKEGWRTQVFKQRQVRKAIRAVLGSDDALVDAVFELVRNQHDY